MIVVDTNIIAYLHIPGSHTEAVERLLVIEPDWIAPRLWLDEFLNVLATNERAGNLSSHEADSILSDAVELMDGMSYDVPSQRVLATARRTKCSAYDSQFLVLAEDLGLELFTFDERLISASNGVARKPA